LNSSVSDAPPTPLTADHLQRQPLVALLRLIRLPPEAGVDEVDVFLEDAEAAEFLRISARTLQRLRQHGAGPPVIRIGRRRLVYRLADLQKWARDQSVPPTREANVGGPMPERAGNIDPPEPAVDEADDPPPDVCGRCRSFGDGHCFARGFAVDVDEPRCPLFVESLRAGGGRQEKSNL